MKDTKTHSLPKQMERAYHLHSLLSLHENAVVFSVEKREGSSKKSAGTMPSGSSSAVLKVIPKSYFDETLLHTLQSLHHPLILLPTEVFTEEEYVYAIYPRLLSFSEYLYRGKISFSVIVQWMKDMDQIVSCLHKKNILHGDIAPGNIYLDEEGHFYLGDFSSGKILSPFGKFTSLLTKKKTAATFPCPLPITDFRQDIYSFLTILSQLLKSFSSLTEEETAVLSVLQTSTEKLLLETVTERRFGLSFHQVCKKLLTLIEREQLKTTFKRQKILLSHQELDFLKEATHTVRKTIFPSYFPFQAKIPVPILGLSFCVLLFLSASIYYAAMDNFPHKGASPPALLAGELEREQASHAPYATSTPAGHTASHAPYATSTPAGQVTSHAPYATSTPAGNAAPHAQPPPTPAPDRSILDISHGKHRKIPGGKSAASPVKIIFAENNRFEKLSSFSIYSSLEELYLDSNAIADVRNISALKSLAVLGLSNNQITDVSALGNLPSLSILDLSCQTKLSNLSSLDKLKKLKYLVLTDTNAADKDIQHLQRALPHCTILY